MGYHENMINQPIIANMASPLTWGYSMDSAYPVLLMRKSAFLVAVGMAYHFRFLLAPPMATVAGAQLVAEAVMKLYRYFDVKAARQFKLKMLTFNQEHPKWQFIIFLVSIATAKIWVSVSCFFGALLGVYSAMIALEGHYKQSHPGIVHLPQSPPSYIT